MKKKGTSSPVSFSFPCVCVCVCESGVLTVSLLSFSHVPSVSSIFHLTWKKLKQEKNRQKHIKEQGKIAKGTNLCSLVFLFSQSASLFAFFLFKTFYLRLFQKFPVGTEFSFTALVTGPVDQNPPFSSPQNRWLIWLLTRPRHSLLWRHHLDRDREEFQLPPCAAVAGPRDRASQSSHP